jgi:hypothetical protein
MTRAPTLTHNPNISFTDRLSASCVNPTTGEVYVIAHQYGNSSVNSRLYGSGGLIVPLPLVANATAGLVYYPTLNAMLVYGSTNVANGTSSFVGAVSLSTHSWLWQAYFPQGAYGIAGEALRPVGNTFLADANGSMTVFDVSTGNVLSTQPAWGRAVGGWYTVQDQVGDALAVTGPGALVLVSATNATVLASAPGDWSGVLVAAFTPSGRLAVCVGNGSYVELDAVTLQPLASTLLSCAGFLAFSRGYVYTIATQFTDATYQYMNYYLARVKPSVGDARTLEVGATALGFTSDATSQVSGSFPLSDEQQVGVLFLDYYNNWNLIGVDLLSGTVIWVQGLASAISSSQPTPLFYSGQQQQSQPVLNQFFRYGPTVAGEQGVRGFSIFDGTLTWQMPSVYWLSPRQPMALISNGTERYQMVFQFEYVTAQYGDSGLRLAAPPVGFRNATGVPNFPTDSHLFPSKPTSAPQSVTTLPPTHVAAPASGDSKTKVIIGAVVGAAVVCIIGGIVRWMLRRHRSRQPAGGIYAPVTGEVVRSGELDGYAAIQKV